MFVGSWCSMWPLLCVLTVHFSRSFIRLVPLYMCNHTDASHEQIEAEAEVLYKCKASYTCLPLRTRKHACCAQLEGLLHHGQLHLSRVETPTLIHTVHANMRTYEHSWCAQLEAQLNHAHPHDIRSCCAQLDAVFGVQTSRV